MRLSSPTISRLAVVIVCLVVSWLPVSAQSQEATLADPAWGIGDIWTWRLPDATEISWAVVDVADDHYLIAEHQQVGEPRLLRVPRDPVIITVAPVWVGDPFLRLTFPLRIGTKSVGTRTGITGGGVPANTWRTEWTIAAKESIHVPAGTFDATRADGVQCNVTVSECGRVSVWFAVSAKAIVKIAWGPEIYWKGVRGKAEELVRYTLM